ncbi:ribosomal L33 family protein [Bacillus cereus ATCC 4342]|nr:ribosomal L33 family protein [Bacillus cereus ATCC 4342]
MRVNITLACTECGDRNYISKKTNETIQSASN